MQTLLPIVIGCTGCSIVLTLLVRSWWERRQQQLRIDLRYMRLR